jgi:hypothetical protein
VAGSAGSAFTFVKNDGGAAGGGAFLRGFSDVRKAAEQVGYQTI